MIADYERKLLIGITLLTLASIPALGYALYSLSTITRAEGELYSSYTNTLLLAENLRFEKSQQNSLMPLFVLSGDVSILDHLHQSDRRFEMKLQKLNETGQTAEVKQTLARVRSLQQDLIALEQPGIDMREHGIAIADVNEFFRKTGGPLTGSIITALDGLEQEASTAFQQERTHYKKVLNNVVHILAVASVMSVVFCIAVVRVLLRLVAQKREHDAIAERLAQQERSISHARKEAVEIVAHDLRAPLGAVMMAAELVQKRSELPETSRSRKLIETIVQSAGSMGLLINNLLDHAKIEAGSLSLSKTPANLTSIVAAVISQFEMAAAAKGVMILNEIDAGLPKLLLDEARMGQVLSNLVGNAVKFTPSGGNVRLVTRVRQGMFTISVIDTGPGMTEEQAAYVFEKYWQSRETSAQGVGLGLTIVRAIIEAHGGTVGVTSVVGAGCTFDISLPLQTVAVPPSECFPTGLIESRA